MNEKDVPEFEFALGFVRQVAVSPLDLSLDPSPGGEGKTMHLATVADLVRACAGGEFKVLDIAYPEPRRPRRRAPLNRRDRVKAKRVRHDIEKRVLAKLVERSSKVHWRDIARDECRGTDQQSSEGGEMVVDFVAVPDKKSA